MQLREPAEALCPTLHPIRTCWPLNATALLLRQVYVRRGYIAYELNSLQHRELPDGTCFVEFQFMLPSSHPNRYGMFLLVSFLTLLSLEGSSRYVWLPGSRKGDLFPPVGLLRPCTLICRMETIIHVRLRLLSSDPCAALKDGE